MINRRRFSYLFESSSMNYNHNQHAISTAPASNLDTNDDSDATTQQKQVARLQYNPYEKLEQSLISGKY